MNRQETIRSFVYKRLKAEFNYDLESVEYLDNKDEFEVCFMSGVSAYDEDPDSADTEAEVKDLKTRINKIGEGFFEFKVSFGVSWHGYSEYTPDPGDVHDVVCVWTHKCSECNFKLDFSDGWFTCSNCGGAFELP